MATETYLHEPFRTEYPEIWAAYKQTVELCYEQGPLDRKTKELITVAVLATLRYASGVKAHAEAAVAAGATLDEVRQAILLTLGRAGAAAVLESMQWLRELEAQLAAGRR